MTELTAVTPDEPGQADGQHYDLVLPVDREQQSLGEADFLRLRELVLRGHRIRVGLTLADSDAARVDIEQAIRSRLIAQGIAPELWLTRVSGIPPRVKQRMLRLPLQVLLLTSAMDGAHETFEQRWSDCLDRAASQFPSIAPPPILAATETARRVLLPGRPARPADVLCVEDVLAGAAELAQREPLAKEDLLLGWLEQTCLAHQTRLLVLPVAEGFSPLVAAVAARLVERGGPAVLTTFHQPPGELLLALARLALSILHADQLEVALARVFASTDIQFYAGSGREDLLSLNALDHALAELGAQSHPLQRDFYQAGPGDGRMWSSRLSPILRRHVDERQRSELDRGTQIAQLSQTFAEIESVTDLASPWSPNPAVGGESVAEPMGTSRHYAHALLRSDHGPADATPIAAATGLACGQCYQLHLSLSRSPSCLQVDSPIGISLSPPAGSPRGGRFVQVGVSGIDFAVHGEPLQTLFVPQAGDSEVAVFVVAPREQATLGNRPTRWFRLRFAIYVESLLLQSFLLIAKSGRPAEDPAVAEQDDLDAAALLALPTSKSPPADGPAYRYRLEFSIQSDLTAAVPGQLPAVSIIANHSGDESVVTVKAGQTLSTRRNQNIPRFAANIRRALESAAGLTDSQPSYRFSRSLPAAIRERNGAAAFRQLAVAGWELFDSLFSNATKRLLRQHLAEPDQVVQVAPVHLDGCLPWGALYDQHIVSGDTLTVCTAALPSADGHLAAPRCGSAPGCPLAAAGSSPTAAEKVVCPGHFWGIRHQIEVPLHRVDGTGEGVRTLATDIRCENRQIKLAAGLHRGLAWAAKHQKEIEQQITAGQVEGAHVVISAPQFASAKSLLLDLLAQPDLAIVYLYCHAHDEVDRAFAPHLGFASTVGGAVEQLRAADLREVTWRNNPLVFLNGCGTIAFSPQAVSPFVNKFLDDFGAAAMLGTEARVFEELAGDVALEFFRVFLTGQGAGAALLRARRVLLSRHNPLGLIYTLFGSSSLRLIL